MSCPGQPGEDDVPGLVLIPLAARTLVGASERDTNLIFRTLHNTGRVLKNTVSDGVVATVRRAGG